jgi:hypothetical protein
MVRNKGGGSRAAACAVAFLMALSLGALANQAYAQTQGPAQPQAAPTSQVPQPAEGGVNWSGAGYGAASLVSNVFYIPAKLVYGVLGGLVGGATWLITAGNSQTADTVWRSSLGGDWVVTPGMIAGTQPLHFSGPTETSPVKSQVQAIAQPSPAPSPAMSAAPAAIPSESTGASSLPSTGEPIDSGVPPAAGAGTRRPAPPALPDTSIE